VDEIRLINTTHGTETKIIDAPTGNGYSRTIPCGQSIKAINELCGRKNCLCRLANRVEVNGTHRPDLDVTLSIDGCLHINTTYCSAEGI